jgi:hypothetical protein
VDPSKTRLAEMCTSYPCPPRPEEDVAKAISELLLMGSTAVANASLTSQLVGGF